MRLRGLRNDLIERGHLVKEVSREVVRGRDAHLIQRARSFCSVARPTAQRGVVFAGGRATGGQIFLGAARTRTT